MIEEQDTTITDWRSDITPSRQTLKIKDGEIVRATFLNEGRKKESADYGTSIAFDMIKDGEDEPRTFYVKANNFDLLGQIKELGKLTSLRVEISRTGSKRSDTRYKVKRV